MIRTSLSLPSMRSCHASTSAHSCTRTATATCASTTGRTRMPTCLVAHHGTCACTRACARTTPIQKLSSRAKVGTSPVRPWARRISRGPRTKRRKTSPQAFMPKCIGKLRSAPCSWPTLRCAYPLGKVKDLHWRAICVGRCAPDEYQLPLKDLTVFGTADDVVVSYEAYPDIVQMWVTLLSFQRSRKKLALLGRGAEAALPPDTPLPALHDLFRGEVQGEGVAEMV